MKKILFGLSLMLLSGPSHSAGNTDLGDGFVNVALPPYGAAPRLGSSCVVSDDVTSKIQTALNDVAADGGGTVHLPEGVYCIYGHLTIGDYTTLKGVFNSPPSSYPVTTATPKGTTLIALENAGLPAAVSFITIPGSGAGLDGLAIHYPNQTVPTGPTWSPVQYPFTINVPGHDVQLRNVFLHNPYMGIKLDGAGRHILKGIFGQPILLGMHVDQIYDVGRISDVHFWPFWTENPVVMKWIQQNGYGMHFYRTDWQMGENIFTFGYRMGMTFAGSPVGVGAANGTFTNVGHDASQFGVVFYETQKPGVLFTNLNIALTSTSPNYGIANLSPAGKSSYATIMNGSIWGLPTNSVIWSGEGNLMMSGVRINEIASGQPAVIINSGSAMISNNTFLTSGPSGVAVRVAAGAGKVLVGGNMLFGNTVQNFGPSTTIATNSP